jgi:hypothetical protein
MTRDSHSPLSYIIFRAFPVFRGSLIPTMELRNAALVLSDISGYTNFLQLHSMSLLHAEKIVTELMEAVIDASSHPLTLNKLEGDALLFYAVAENADDPSELSELCRDVLKQSLAFFDAFRTTADSLIGCNICPCDACRQVDELQLKSFLHFGEVAVKQVRTFEELAGQVVIVTHRLAKNSIPSDEYLLLTDTFYETAFGAGESEDITFENRTENCEGIGPVPIKVYYPNPAPPPSPRKLLPTLYNAVRLDLYGALRTVSLTKKPPPMARSIAEEACNLDAGEEKKSVTLASFIGDAFTGLGMVLRGKGK